MSGKFFIFITFYYLAGASCLLNNGMKTCKIEGCHEECYANSRYCHRHYLDRKAEQRKARKDAGLKYRTIYTKTCACCGKEYTASNNKQKGYCKDCREIVLHFAPSNISGGQNYKYSKHEYSVSVLEHRCIATKILERKLNSTETVHHIDGITNNNDPTNLLVLSNGNHHKLHRYINEKLCTDCRGDKNMMNELWNTKAIIYTEEWMADNKDKCTLLSDVDNYQEKLNTRLGEYKTKTVKSTSSKTPKQKEPKHTIRFCKTCGKELTSRQLTFCSYDCQHAYDGRNVPSKEELIEVIKSKTSVLQIAKHFDVTDNNVRKWLSKHNINIYDFGYRKLKNK